jgi:(p)ppGpp synthase/HD superfamily hydrolase
MVSLNPQSRKEIQRAVNFAVKAHAGQFRKCGLPYIVHPMAVMAQLRDWGITNFVTWKAAVCHDVWEEQPAITMPQLSKVLGEEAALVVDELTFRPEDNGVPAKQQKPIYLRTFYDKSVHALAVKVADRLSNVCDFLAVDPQYAKKYYGLAEDLFGAMIAREDEIKEFFQDEGVFTAMMHTRTSVTRML